MGKLDSLKIDDSPLAFASFAAKHNALVDLLAGMVGQNGISVVMAEKNAIIRANIAQNVNLSTTANLVGSTGYLANAYVANANIGTYPTELKVVNGTKSIVLNSSGIVLSDSSSGAFINLLFPGASGAFGTVANGAMDLQVFSNPLGNPRTLGLGSIDVCDGGVANTMWILRQDP